MSEALQGYLQEALQPAQAALAHIAELSGKKDSDFLVDGNVNSSLKAANTRMITAQRKEYQESVEGAIRGVREADIPDVDEFGRTVVYGSLLDDLYIFDDSRKKPTLPESTAFAAENCLARTERLAQVLAYWRNPLPYFVSLKKDGASVHVSRGADNTVLYKEGQFSIHDHPGIVAKFGSGHGIEVSGRDALTQVKHNSTATFALGLYGYDGRRHATLEEFGNTWYNQFFFVDPNEAFTHGNAVQRFALRAAFMHLALEGVADEESTQSEVDADAPEIVIPDIPLPGKSFRDKLQTDLAQSITDKFKDRNFHTTTFRRSPDLRIAGARTVDISGTLDGQTFTSLGVILSAAGITVESLASETLARAASAHDTDDVVGYIKAMNDDNPKIAEFLKVLEDKLKP